jgi:hypothetical protein
LLRAGAQRAAGERSKAVRFDPAARTLEIGVIDLALAAAGGPGPGFSGRGDARSAWLGQSLHVAYQRSAAEADASFEAEVALHESFRHRGWQISLRGRADGIRPEAPGWLVEELKSRAARREPWLPAWRLQAALYARMLERARRAPARAELVWIGGPAPVRERVELAHADVERALASALDAVLAELARRLARRASWRAAAGAVRFPFPTLRAGQAEILASVEAAPAH